MEDESVLEGNGIQTWPWDEESPEIQEFRLSVQSLLRGSDRDMLEIASEVLTGIQGTMSKAWAVEVMKDIFSRFGLEYKNTMYDEVSTPRWSMIEYPGVEKPADESIDQEGSADEALEKVEESPEEELLEEKATEDIREQEMQIVKLKKAPTAGENVGEDGESEKSHPAVGEEDSDGERSKWQTPPQTPKESIVDSGCIPCASRRFSLTSSRRFSCGSSRRFSSSTPRRLSSGGPPPSRRMLTPPTSAEEVIKAVIPAIEHEGRADSTIHRASTSPGQPKKSFMNSLKKRLRRTSRKLRISIIGRSSDIPPVLDHPSPTPPQKSNLRPGSEDTKEISTEDADPVLRGPTLKLNRLSDMTLPLTTEERNEIARRRARESKLTEDFDLVVRMGTLGDAGARESVSVTSMDIVGDSPEPPIDPASIPAIPMIEPEYFSKISPDTTPSSGSEEINRSASARIAPPRRSLRLSMLGKRKSFSRPIEKPGTTRPVPRIRNALSENNLRILNARMGSIPPPVPSLPPSSQIRSRTPSSHRRKSSIPERSVSMSSRLVSDSPLANRCKETCNARSTISIYGLLPPRANHCIGTHGGRIGVVQMGSAYQANKILGDVVLLVPENQDSEKETTKFTSQYFCTPNDTSRINIEVGENSRREMAR